MRRNHVSSNPVFHWRTEFLPTRYCHGSVWTPLITRNSVPAKVNISFFPEKSSGYSFKLFSTVTLFFILLSVYSQPPSLLGVPQGPSVTSYLQPSSLWWLDPSMPLSGRCSQNPSDRCVWHPFSEDVPANPLSEGSSWHPALTECSEVHLGATPHVISLNDYFCDPSLTECLGIFLSDRDSQHSSLTEVPCLPLS